MHISKNCELETGRFDSGGMEFSTVKGSAWTSGSSSFLVSNDSVEWFNSVLIF